MLSNLHKSVRCGTSRWMEWQWVHWMEWQWMEFSEWEQGRIVKINKFWNYYFIESDVTSLHCVSSSSYHGQHNREGIPKRWCQETSRWWRVTCHIDGGLICEVGPPWTAPRLAEGQRVLARMSSISYQLLLALSEIDSRSSHRDWKHLDTSDWWEEDSAEPRQLFITSSQSKKTLEQYQPCTWST